MPGNWTAERKHKCLQALSDLLNNATQERESISFSAYVARGLQSRFKQIVSFLMLGKERNTMETAPIQHRFSVLVHNDLLGEI